MKLDIVNAFECHDLHILCLTELGVIHARLTDNLKAWIMDLLVDTAVAQVTVHAGVDYVTIVNQEDVVVAGYEFISGFIPEQAWRSFQHLRVRLHGHDKLVSVINCHATSSTKEKLTVNRRLSYLNAFHTTSGADPFIWGVDFNTALIQLTTLLQSVDRRYSAEQPGPTKILACFCTLFESQVRHTNFCTELCQSMEQT